MKAGPNPIVAICGCRRDAARAAWTIREAGLALRQITVVEREYPSPEAAAKLEQWPALASAWVTAGCLNAIGAGLESVGVPRRELHRCRAALGSNRLLVIVQGTAEEVVRARRRLLQCPLKSARKRSS